MAAEDERSTSESAHDSFLRAVAEAPAHEAPARSTGASRDVDPERVAHFRVLGRLGSGGMGIVYRAHDDALRRDVALKLLPPTHAGDVERKQRFLREARAAAALIHPNVAVVHQVGEADGRVYIAMELVHGTTLRERLETGALPMEEARRLALQIAMGLAAAHARSIVHRDLKPENVMVTPEGAVKLLDFGLAKNGGSDDSDSALAVAATEAQITREGDVLGSSAYMSPEQALGVSVDARSDVFSFGIVLYELLAGVRPFGGATHGETRSAIVRDAPVDLAARVPGAPKGLVEVVARCLAKRPEERFAGAREIVEALTASETSGAGLGRAREIAARGAMSRGRWVAVGAALVALFVLVALLVRGRASHVPPPAARPIQPVVDPLDAVAGLAETALLPPNLDDPASARFAPDARSYVVAMRSGLWIYSLVGDAPRRLLLAHGGEEEPGCMDAAFVADGSSVVAACGASSKRPALYRAALDGSVAQKMRDLPGEEDPEGMFGAFSADARRVAWFAERALVVGDVDAASVTRVVELGEDEVGRAVAWSPAGDRLVFVREKQFRPATLETVAIQGGAPSSVSTIGPQFSNDDHGALHWPAPNEIVYVLNVRPGGDLWRARVDDSGAGIGAPTRIRAMRDTDFASVDTRDGKWLFVSKRSVDEVRLSSISTDARHLAKPLQRRASIVGQSWGPAWLPDGGLVTVGRAGAGTKWLVQRGDGPPQTAWSGIQMSQALGLCGASLLWRNPTEPDGGGSCSIMRTPADSDVADTVADCEVAKNCVQAWGLDVVRCPLSPEAPWLVTEQAHGVVLMKHFDPKERRISPPFYRTAGLVRGSDLSSKGDIIVASVDGKLHVISGDGLRDQTIPVDLEIVQGVSLTPDDRNVVVTGMRLDESYVVSVPIQGGPTQVLIKEKSSWLEDVQVGPHDELAVTMRSYDPGVWLLSAP